MTDALNFEIQSDIMNLIQFSQIPTAILNANTSKNRTTENIYPISRGNDSKTPPINDNKPINNNVDDSTLFKAPIIPVAIKEKINSEHVRKPTEIGNNEFQTRLIDKKQRIQAITDHGRAKTNSPDLRRSYTPEIIDVVSSDCSQSNLSSPVSAIGRDSPVLFDGVLDGGVNPHSTSPSIVTKCNAIIQTDEQIKPDMVTRGTQTKDSFIKMENLYEEYKTHLKSETMSNFKPMYQLNNNDKENPPLKIGLTLPRGVKRKVYYPDLEED